MATVKKKVRQVYLFAFEENGVEVIMCGRSAADGCEFPFSYLGEGGEGSLEGARAQAQRYANHYGFPVRVIGFGQRRQVCEVLPEETAFPEAPEAGMVIDCEAVRVTPVAKIEGGNDAPVG